MEKCITDYNKIVEEISNTDERIYAIIHSPIDDAILLVDTNDSCYYIPNVLSPKSIESIFSGYISNTVVPGGTRFENNNDIIVKALIQHKSINYLILSAAYFNKIYQPFPWSINIWTIKKLATLNSIQLQGTLIDTLELLFPVINEHRKEQSLDKYKQPPEPEDPFKAIYKNIDAFYSYSPIIHDIYRNLCLRYEIGVRYKKEIYKSDNAINNSIDVSNLSSGVYFVTFKSDTSSVTKKFIKE